MKRSNSRKRAEKNSTGAEHSRRSFLKASLGVAGSATIAPLLSNASIQSNQKDLQARERIERQTHDPRGRILIKGATILSMDPQVGDFLKGDLLIEGKKIIDVKPQIKASAEVLDASGTIMVPGFADTHRHPWGRFWIVEGLSQQIFTARPGPSPMALLNSKVEPEDVYAATLVTALTCIKSGVTCMMDWSGNSLTPQHADSEIQALSDSGLRAVFGYGAPPSGSSYLPADLDRIQKRYFSSADQLVTLCMAMNIRSPEDETIGKIKFARDHGLRVTMDGNDFPVEGETIQRLGKTGIFGSDITFVHCNDIGDGAWRVIADAGSTVSTAAFSEPLIGIATGIPAIQSALNFGIRPSLSSDVFQFSDFFTVMRMALCFQRQQAFIRVYAGDKNAPPPVTMRDVLDFATVQGSKANGLLNKSGTLTPGKEADIVLIRADEVNTVTLPNALGAVVLGADTSNVETVFIAGKLRKFKGQLVGADVDRATRLYQQSCEKIYARAAYNHDFLKQ
jgi:5-methylthioadenosine/S-adenosylhomocysteine deaminase